MGVPLRPGQFTIETAALTERGRVRDRNEDSILWIDLKGPGAYSSDSFGIYLIADGMGGHLGGEVASRIASETIWAILMKQLTGAQAEHTPVQLLIEAIETAHHRVLDAARARPELRSMGSTITVGLRLGLQLFVGHVGDSRAYLIRGSTIRQLTEDHSVVAQLMRSGLVTSREADSHPDRGKITRSLGITRGITVDTLMRGSGEEKLALHVGDSLLFCSDGLTDSLSDGEILECVDRTMDAGEACRGLVELANARGGGDNVSVIVVRVKL